ncbi:MAG: hypothetical protein KFB95_09065 [Simkaniaceae bacterium]|nr:MAG: hypothetical protein KFB95_09065 [Simkaniaceae bacterium]
MATRLELPLDRRLCNLLPTAGTLNRPTIKTLAKMAKTIEAHAINIIGSMLARAFGRNYFETFKKCHPTPILQRAYLEGMEIIQATNDSIKKSCPLEHNKSLQRRIDEMNFNKVHCSAMQFWNSWKRLGMDAQSRPLDKTVDDSLYEYAVNAQKQIDRMVETLYFYFANPSEQIEELPYVLLPLINSVAIKHPERNLSWYDIVKLYGIYVEDAKKRSDALIENFPFHQVMKTLDWSSPPLTKKVLPNQSFREFTARMTIRSMGHFFGSEIPEPIEKLLLPTFMENEDIRIELINFISHICKKMKKDPFYSMPEEEHRSLTTKKHSKLFIFSLMSLRIHRLLIEPGKIDPSSSFILWAFESNRTCVQRLDFFRYPKPKHKKGQVDEFYFSPEELVPLIMELQPLYTNNGELFHENALNLAMGFLPIPRESHQPIVQLLTEWNKHPLALITTKQILDYLILDHKRPIDEMNTFLLGLMERIPKNVQGKSREFFDCLPKRATGRVDVFFKQIEIETFNSSLKIKENETIDASLYFSVLGYLIEEKVSVYQFDIIELYEDPSSPFSSNQKLDFLIRVAVEKSRSDAVLVKNLQTLCLNSPLSEHLLDSLLLVSDIKEDGIRLTLKLFQSRLLKGESLPTESVREFRMHSLSLLSKTLAEEHITKCFSVINQYKYPFTTYQKLHIFHEILSLQNTPNHLDDLLKFITRFEDYIGMNLDAQTVCNLLTYHPNIQPGVNTLTFKLLSTQKSLFADSKEAHSYTSGLPESVTGPINRLMTAMNDEKRNKELKESTFLPQNVLTTFEGYLLFATLEPFEELRFIVSCHHYPYAKITPSQMTAYLESSHRKPANGSRALLTEFTNQVPKSIQGKSEVFFDCLCFDRNLTHQEFLAKQQRFNLFLSSNTEKTISASLYFEAFLAFLSGRIIPHHFEIFDAYQDEHPHLAANQKLTFLMSATDTPPLPLPISFEDSEVVDSIEESLFFRALSLASSERARDIEWVMKRFEREFSKLSLSEHRFLLSQELPRIPESPKDEHIDYIKREITETLGHPFNPKELLYLFYALVSFQEKELEIYSRAQLVKLLEKFQGHHISTSNVVLLLSHEEAVDYSSAEARLQDLDLVREELIKKGAIDSPKPPAKTLEQIQDLACEILNPLKLFSRPDLAAFILSTLYSASVYNSIEHVTRTLPTEIDRHSAGNSSLVFPEHSPNEALLPLSIGEKLEKYFYLSWSISDGKILANFSLVAADTLASYSGSALFPLPINHYQRLDELFNLFAKTLFYVGCDGVDQTDVPIETPKDFQNHPKIQPFLEKISYKNKKPIIEALHLFIIAMRSEHRKVFLSLATHTKHKDSQASPQNLRPETLSSFVRSGNIFPMGICHSIVPPEVLDQTRRLAPCYSSSEEIKQINTLSLFSNLLLQLKVEISLIITENYFHIAKFPCTLTVRSVKIDYDNQALLELEKERSGYQSAGIEIVLETTFMKQPIKARVIYPTNQLQTEEELKKSLSWQIMRLKHSLYLKILELQEFAASVKAKKPAFLILELPDHTHAIKFTASPLSDEKYSLFISFRNEHFHTAEYDKKALEDLSELKKILIDGAALIQKEAADLSLARDSNILESAGSEEVLLINENHWVIDPETLPACCRENAESLYSSKNEIESFPFDPVLSTIEDSMGGHSFTAAYQLELTITENLWNEIKLPMLWEVSRQSEKISYRLNVDWMRGVGVSFTGGVCFFLQPEYTKNRLSYHVALLKTKVYILLHSLQPFLKRLMNKEDSHWKFPLPLDSYIQVKGTSEEENYRLIFIESFGKECSRKEVIAYYSEIQNESDLLNLLSQHLRLSSAETFPKTSLPLSPNTQKDPHEIQFEPIPNQELSSKTPEPPSQESTSKPSRLDQVTGWIGGLLFEKKEEGSLRTSESSIGSEGSSGDADDY